MNRIHLALERSFGMGWDRKEGKGKEHSDGVLDFALLDFAFSSLGRSSLRPSAGKTQTKDLLKHTRQLVNLKSLCITIFPLTI
jgi:hypothetical protein